VNISDLEATLPNGFHDALLRAFTFDAVRRAFDAQLDISIGDPDARSGDARDAHRSARLTMTGVCHLSIDPPGPGASRSVEGPLMLDLCDSDDRVIPPSSIPVGGFAAKLFVAPWNAFIHIAAQEATLTWTVDGAQIAPS